MLRRTPTLASITTRLEPPYETNGSGIPVSGATPVVAAMLIAACPQTSAVTPAASRLANGSRETIASRTPAYANAQNAATRSATPTSPSSSPTTASIMSVCASGR